MEVVYTKAETSPVLFYMQVFNFSVNKHAKHSWSTASMGVLGTEPPVDAKTQG